ncbi:Cell division protein FtsI/penicillin-binding protein 2 [Pseudomonas syringae pv. actinidiae]|uniref:Cell division protein FtsI/penicillin-binding protein 2 n=1 Tax=Pseudomonas syringae pv. actinidiae TaxID=103796 RepID=A0A2V0QII7_PSESF|nr:Cell division protein FtsI/penicillin-binding protein 2 [Pseudomonas syringae pv. actinidiae]
MRLLISMAIRTLPGRQRRRISLNLADWRRVSHHLITGCRPPSYPPKRKWHNMPTIKSTCLNGTGASYGDAKRCADPSPGSGYP